MVISHWSLVIGHWSLVIGHWSLVIGHGFNAISNQSLIVIGQQPRTTKNSLFPVP
ncbi:hypothetical protein [Coleofasciculus sp. E1-EBD-02]|uniref:hypothetical protein n=1 Tax=Coleofasciculus sp. E1-EBD-02 TaxID=3068481 RepID=UPI0032FFE71B